jgi:hypothetical protein
MNQEKLGDETKELFKNSLAINIRHQRPDGGNTAVSNMNLGFFYRQLADLHPELALRNAILILQAKAYFEEATRIRTKIFSPSHPNVYQAVSQLMKMSRDPESKPALLRDTCWYVF